LVLIFARVTAFEKKALDLEMLTFNPEVPINLVKISSITRVWEVVALEKRKTTFSKK